jgi:hypothetical protein
MVMVHRPMMAHKRAIHHARPRPPHPAPPQKWRKTKYDEQTCNNKNGDQDEHGVPPFQFGFISFELLHNYPYLIGNLLRSYYGMVRKL